jgi:hypothetical protein
MTKAAQFLEAISSFSLAWCVRAELVEYLTR